MKICKTCRFWSMEKKGFCHLDHRGVGQFWNCEQWQGGTPEDRPEQAQAERPCQVCAVRSH